MRVSLSTAVVSAALLFSGAAPAVSSTIVISEFRSRGPNGANDEFIELFNKSNAPVVVTGWRILVSDSSGSTTVLRQLGTVTIPARRFYLLANNGIQGYSGTVAPNATYTVAIPDDGGIALEPSPGVILDEVGMSAGSAYQEGTPLSPLTVSSNQSYERNDGGCTPGRDTDDNSLDFRFNSTRSFPQNAGTVCNPCQGVQCTRPLNTQCWTSPGTCSQGVCNYPQLSEGSACTDGDPCTTGDACAADGSCLSGQANPCDTPPPAFCSDPQTSVAHSPTGSCSSAVGCAYTEIPTACAFGCNGTTGECRPDPCTNVACNTPPPGGCYEPAGTCQAGSCVYTTRAAGTACTDGNACTVGDVCNARGGCLAGASVPVNDGNPCTVDRCVRATGQVTHAPVANGTTCDDGNACNGISTCQAGACAAGAPVVCNTPPLGDCYEASGSCNPVSGACSYPFSVAGTVCSDADACTTGDQCDGNGVCGGSATVCVPPAPQCIDPNASRVASGGTCSAISGQCAFVNTDTSCVAGCDPTSGLCNADPCIGVACDAPPTECHVDPGVCTAGTCGYPLKPSGAACDDGDPCTSLDSCGTAGGCTGTPLLCNAPPLPFCVGPDTARQFEPSGTCSAGVCDYPPTDVACSLGCDAATGICRGDPCASAACDEPPSQCHAGQGSCSGGICSYPLKPGGSDCDDGNLCTEADACSTVGACAGAPVTCNAPPPAVCVDASTSRVFQAVGACSAANGECTYAPLDTTCQAGCDTATGLCDGDLCAGVTCTTPTGACFFGVGSCFVGVCTYAPRPSGVLCDDGDSCTDADVCDGGGTCSGSSSPACVDGGVDGGGTGGSGGTDGGLGGTDGGLGGTDGGLGGTDGGLGGTDGGVGGTDGGLGGTDGGLGGTDGGIGGSGAVAGAGGGLGGTDGGIGGSGAVAGAGGGGGQTSSGGRSGSGGEGSDGTSGAVVEGGGCDCSLHGTKRNPGWALALLVGGLFIGRRRRRLETNDHGRSR